MKPTCLGLQSCCPIVINDKEVPEGIQEKDRAEGEARPKCNARAAEIIRYSHPPGAGELNIANRVLLPVGKDLLAGDVKAKLTTGICSGVLLPSLTKASSRHS